MRIIGRFLCENYDAILIPYHKSNEMVQAGKRKIQSETARKMLTWSYYKFKQIMQAKAKPYDCLIFLVQSTVGAKHVQNVVALTISWEATRFTIANNVWNYYGTET
jgi:hypothetical protein